MTGKRRALWTAGALLVAIVVSIGTIWVARRAVGADSEQLAAQAVEMALAQSPRRSAGSDDQARAQMLPFMRMMIGMYPLTTTVGILFGTILISSVLMGAYRVFGVRVGWTMAFAACSTGVAATALVQFCVTLLVVFVMKKSIPAESFLDNSIVPLNLAAFLPADVGAVWRSAAAKLDVLQVVFVIGLVAYLVDEEGFARDARKIIAATIVCYVLWILLGMGWTAAWSGLAG